MTALQPRIVEHVLPPRQLWAGSSALSLHDIFPNVTAMVQRDPTLIVVAGAERWSTSLESEDGLWTLEVENESCSVWRHKRWTQLSSGVTLNLIRDGNVLPQQLELVFWSLDSQQPHTLTLEHWTFGPSEWEMVDWSYFSPRKRSRASHRLHAAGIDADFRSPHISFRFRLLPKPVDLSRMKLLAYCGTAYPLPGRRR